MVTRIRRACLTDLVGVADVVTEVWDQEILRDVFEAQVTGNTSALWVAEINGDVAGFVSAFLTRGEGGVRRWEIDLVAVRPARQGQGLGRKLIRRASRDRRGHRAAVARAVLRVDNLPSQQAFRRAGFSGDGATHRLLLWPPKPGEVPEVSTGHCLCVPVDTLTYRGLWIEGLVRLTPAEQRSLVENARATIARQNRINAGALIPAHREHLLAPDLRDQARMHGNYYWFVRPRGRAGGTAG